MNVTGATELARMKMLQRQAGEVRGALDRAAYEATTSLKADKCQATPSFTSYGDTQCYEVSRTERARGAR
jgi:hypothetical protein